MTAYPFIFIIEKLDILLPWNSKSVKRTISLFFTALIVTFVVSLSAHIIVKYTDPLYFMSYDMMINELILYSVVNLIMLAVLEAWMFHESERIAKLESDELKIKLLKVNYEVLKNQIEPHFLFNSMSVLISLISTDPHKAQIFVKEFTLIYRYIIETIDRQLVTLGEEIDFINSYLFLQKIRFGEYLIYQIPDPKEYDNYSLPPMSIQLLVENSIKHNKISSEEPLSIVINIESDKIVVTNNLNVKKTTSKTSGIGLTNLKSRYRMICDRSPEILVDKNFFIVILPLLKSNPSNENSINY